MRTLEIRLTELLRSAVRDGIEKMVVGAVLRKGEKVLLLRRRDDDYLGGLIELPSGGVDEGESLLQALKREVKEETGLRVEEISAVLKSFDYQSKSGRAVRQFNFLVTRFSGAIRLESGEHSTYYWVLPQTKTLEKYNISNETKQVILSSVN